MRACPSLDIHNLWDSFRVAGLVMRSCPSWDIDSLWDRVRVEALIVYKIVYELRRWYFMVHRLGHSWGIASLWFRDCVLVETLKVQDKD